MKIAPLLLPLLLASLVCQSLCAATVTLNADDAAGTSSFNTAGNWLPSAVPSAANDYVVARVLRTPTSGAFTFAGNSLTLNSGGTLAFKTTGVITVNNMIMSGGQVSQFSTAGTEVATLAGNISLTAATTSTFNGSTSPRSLVINSLISGTGNIIVTSDAANANGVALAGNNSFTGTTSVNGGVLRLGHASALSTTTGVTLAGGTTLRPTVKDAIINAPITLGIVGTTTTVNASTAGTTGGDVALFTLNGAIGGAGNLTLNGSAANNSFGTIVLNGQSTYTGSTLFTTSADNATLWVRNGINDALPTTTVLTMDGGIGSGSGRMLSYDLNGFDQTLAGLNTVAGYTAYTARNQRVTSAAPATLTINASVASSYGGLGTPSVFSGNPVNPTAIITGAISLVKNGTATFTLAGPNTYTGTTSVNAGTLSITNASGLGTTAGGTTVLSGATLAVNLSGSQTLAENLTFFSDNAVVSGGNRASMNITTTGGNVTTFSGNLVANSQGANLVQWSNTGGGTARYTGDITGNLNGTVLFLRGGSAHEVLGNVNLGANGDLAITDNSTVLIGAAAKTYAWRNTTVSYGTLRLGAANVLPATNAVTLGQNTGTASHLDLNGFNQTIGSLNATTNTATASTVTIDGGNTLTVNGDVTLFSNTDGADTRLTMTGGGALVVNGANIRVGNNTGGANLSSKATLNLSALGSFTTTLSGALTVQASGDNSGGDAASLILSNTANTITAPSVVVGGSATGSANTLQLGGGTNLINADNVRLGSGDRDSGTISFGATATGTFTLRNTAGTGRANITMGNATNQGTGYVQNNVFDTTGHTADLLVGTLTTAPATRTGNMTNTFSFDAGTLDIATINMAVTKGTGTSTNTINIGGGTVLLGNSGAGSVTLASAADGTLNITGGTVTTSVNIAKGAGAGSALINVSGGTDTGVLQLTNNATVSVPINIGGRQGAAATADHLRSVSGNNTISGTITGGTGGDQYNITSLAGTLTISGTVSNTNGPVRDLNFGGAGNISVSGSVTGDWSLNKDDASTLTLSGANTYIGATVVNAGSLTLANSTALGATSSGTSLENVAGATGGNGTTLVLTNNITVAEPLAMNAATGSDRRVSLINSSGNNVYSGPITLSGTGGTQILSNGGTLNVSGSITGSKGLALRGSSTSTSNLISGTVNLGSNAVGKTDGGTWTIASTGHTWSQTNINDGVLRLGIDNALPITAPLVLGQGGATVGRFEMNGFSQTVPFIDVANGSTTATSQTIRNTAAGVSTLTIAGTSAATFEGIITGPINLVKNGAQDQVLSGNNTYSGTTTVNGGRLLINNTTGSGTGSGAVIVNAGGTLGGNGTITTTGLTVNAGGTLAPGNSPENLTVNGPVVLSAGSLFGVEVNVGGVTAVGNGTTGTDLLTVNGTIDLTGALLTGTYGGGLNNVFLGNLNANNMTWIVNNDLLDSITGTFANTSPSPGLSGLFGTPAYFGSVGGQPVAVFYNSQFGVTNAGGLSGGNDLLLIAIPEPSRALLALLALVPLALRRRRI